MHFKGLFSNTAAYLYPAGFAVVVSLSVLLPCRCRPLGGGRARPIAVVTALPRPPGGGGAPVPSKQDLTN